MADTASDDPANLELTPDDMRRLGEEALARVIAHVASIPGQPVRGDVDAERLCLAMREAAPEHGASFEAMLDPLFDDWIPRSFATPSPGYLPGTPDPETFYDPSQYGPELSRGFPGLRIWMCLKVFGAARFRAALAEKRALAVQAADRIAALPGIRMVAPPQLSLFAFYVTRRGATLDEENHATAELLERVRRRGRVMLTGCTVDGRFLGRVCVLSFRTRQAQIDACVEDLASELLLVWLPRRSGS